MKKTVAYISEGRIEEFSVTDGRVDGEYRLLHGTMVFSNYNNVVRDALMLYKGGDRLCTIHKHDIINEPVVSLFKEDNSFTLKTIEHIWGILTNYETVTKSVPMDFEVNLTKAERKLTNDK